MFQIEKLDPGNKRQVRRFSRLPFQFYEDTPQWVPPILMDVEAAINPDKHPFYEHSVAEVYLAVREGKDVGRLAVIENIPFNRYHEVKKAQFYFLECEDNLETAQALFDRAFEWAHKRGLTEMVGPKGVSPLDGYGILVEGFEHRQMMTMMNYNHAYVPKMMEQMGFTKEVDFVSCYADPRVLKFPERIDRIAQRVLQRGTLRVKDFANKRELAEWAPKIGRAYNNTFINNWEYYPLTDREIKYFVDNILTVADPSLIKIILHEDDVVGFLFAFRDISPALQRSKGRLMPLGLVDIMLELRRKDWVSVNGAGILPEFQGHGGNALMYSEMIKTLLNYGFVHAEMTQVAETAVMMRNDLINLGGIPYKNHRIFHRAI